jgi:multidrug resistance protein, MATE family
MSTIFQIEIRKTLQLALPIIVAQVGIVLMGVTDSIVVGRLLGPTALGAAGIAVSISFLIGCIAIGGLSVVAPMISKARVESGEGEVNRLYRAALKASLWLSVGLSVIGWFSVQYFEIFRQTPEITRLAREFLLILLISNVFVYIFVAVKQLADGLSHTNVAMKITLAGVLLNLVFNLLLIEGNLGFPKLGLQGSATATLLTRILMMVGILFFVCRDRVFSPYLNKIHNTLATNALTLKILRLAIPTGLQFFFEIAAFSMAVVMMGWLGEDRLAAHQIVISVASVTYMAASGVAFSGAIRVGEGWGLQDAARVRTSGNAALLLVTSFMTLCMLLMIVFDRFWIGLYISGQETVVSIAVQLMVVAAIFQVSDGFQVVSAALLRGLSDVNMPTLITLFAYWAIALPGGYYLAFHAGMDAVGIWIGLWAGLTMSGILLTLRFYYLAKRLAAV